MKILILLLLLLLTNNINSQNATNIDTLKLVTNDSSNIVKEFLRDIIEHPTKYKKYNFFPNFEDCKMVFKIDAATEYINYWIVNQSKFEDKEDKIIKIDVYRFTKLDILDTSINSAYMGGNGMRNIIDKFNFSTPLTFYSCRFETESGKKVSNLFFFNNGKSWKILFKPFPWKTLFSR